MKTATLIAAYLGSIVAAAYAITHIGTQYAPGLPHVVPVWPGIEAPSGVYIVGLTLVIRDLLTHRISKRTMYGLILIGAGLAAVVSPGVALASAVAFAASETVDYAVFLVAERRVGKLPAIVTSNAVSIVVDSIIFLAVAFHSLQYVEGQIIGKAWATLAAVAVLAALTVIQRRRVAVTA